MDLEQSREVMAAIQARTSKFFDLFDRVRDESLPAEERVAAMREVIAMDEEPNHLRQELAIITERMKADTAAHRAKTKRD